jgi:hypothetical protein
VRGKAIRGEVCAQAPGSGSLLGPTGEKWGCQLSITPPRLPFLRRKGGNSLFSKAKERTIADCWDKMEIPIEVSYKRGGQLIEVDKMTLSPDGKTMTTVVESKLTGRVSTYVAHKQ